MFARTILFLLMGSTLAAEEGGDYACEIVASVESANDLSVEHFFILKVTILTDKKFVILDPRPVTNFLFSNGGFGRVVADFEEVRTLEKGANLIACECRGIREIPDGNGVIQVALPPIKRADILMLEVTGKEEKKGAKTWIKDAVRRHLVMTDENFREKK